jgi:hypothetical protein
MTDYAMNSAALDKGGLDVPRTAVEQANAQGIFPRLNAAAERGCVMFMASAALQNDPWSASASMCLFFRRSRPANKVCNELMVSIIRSHFVKVC